ncbi:MAG TPA: DUF2231 domain-containing protein [Pyrinomonadaceae bacterium]|nr:DUF2231 domain-containing protein [Pyrinomonadaceae bacterium]
MASKASIAGHPVHPMLVPFPLALWTTSFAVDVLFYFHRGGTLPIISKFMLAAGCIGAALAAVPGIIDWLSIKHRETKRIADWHGRLNIIALLVFAASLYLRMKMGGAALVNYGLKIPFLISFLGVILICISGWLGGKLAFEHGVGVKPQHDTPEDEVAKVRFS